MRVYTKVKSARGKSYTCTKCGKLIQPGTTYHEWSFRYGGDRRQHAECGRPKPSQLTQSKLATVYAAIEDAEERVGSAESIDELQDILNDVAQAARDVADEYREAAEAMGAAGESGISAERAEELDSFADEVENTSLTEPDEPDEDEDEAEDADTSGNDPLEDARQEVQDAISNLSL